MNVIMTYPNQTLKFTRKISLRLCHSCDLTCTVLFSETERRHSGHDHGALEREGIWITQMKSAIDRDCWTSLKMEHMINNDNTLGFHAPVEMNNHIDNLVQGSSISFANALAILQSCIKLSIWSSIQSGVMRDLLCPVGLHTLRPRQNGRHFPDDVFKFISLNGCCCIFYSNLIEICYHGPKWQLPSIVSHNGLASNRRQSMI